MTDQVTIFNGENPTPDVVDPTPAPEDTSSANPSIPDSVAEYVGEGKKYSDVSKALESIAPAQTHIAGLEAENAKKDALIVEMQEALVKSKTLDDVLDSIQGSQAPVEIPSTPVIDKTLIDNAVDKAISAKEKIKTEASNMLGVINSMKEKFGDKAEEIFKKVASENDFSIDEFNTLSARKPKTVLKLVGLENALQPLTVRSTGSVNPETLTGVEQDDTKNIKVMHVPGATTSDMVSAWRNAAPTTGE